MMFAIGNTVDLKSIGFNTDNFRKSLDGSLCVIHLEFAETLIPNIRSDVRFKIYSKPDLDTILNSEMWVGKEEEL